MAGPGGEIVYWHVDDVADSPQKDNVWKPGDSDSIETLDYHCQKVINKLGLDIKLPTGFEWDHRTKYVRS